MSYSVGNLHLALTGIDRSATKSIDNVITKLNQLNSALSAFSKSNLAGFSNLSAQLSAFANATSALSFKNFNSFVNKLNKMDFAKVGSGFSELAKAISPFLDKITMAEKGLNALYGVMQKANGKKFAAALGAINESGGSKGGLGGLGSLFNLGKIASTLFLARRLATVVGGIVQKGSEYTETLNLWQVSMRDNLDLAEKFITKMNKAYGISEKTLMNAQAVFKNMIGSLGQVSDQTAYMLSETLIQMSVDFASLYNTTLQQAFSKIQAMLAGQVRPIRSAGLDMTETTLFMYYQQMGGTKTMRQLNRTEKQLLSIYAVFEQMGKAGALGDMTKTLNTFANQTRITAEAWEELMTWTGVVIKHLIQESGILTNVNALLLTMGEIMQAVANSIGAADENFADALFESVDTTNDAMDELQGKLLDFDKFRSMQGQGENFIGIDENLLKAITGYSSVIEQANNKAREQAEIWLQNLGFIDENGDGIYEMTQEATALLDTIKNISIALGVIAGMNLISKMNAIKKAIFGVTAATKGLQVVLVGGVIVALLQTIDAFERGDWVAGVFSATITLSLAAAFIYLNKQALLTVWKTIGKKLIPAITSAILSFGGLKAMLLSVASAAVTGGIAFMGAWAILSLLPKDAQRVVGGIMAIAGAFIALTTAILAYKGVVSWGSALPALTAAIGVAIAGGMAYKGQIESISKMADGGIPDKGTMFVAGEAGAEIVYNTPSGQSGVVNVQQIQQAMYGALVAYGRNSGGGAEQPIVVQIDGEKVFQATKKSAKRHGLSFAKV